jgi:hypothetical protein
MNFVGACAMTAGVDIMPKENSIGITSIVTMKDNKKDESQKETEIR